MNIASATRNQWAKSVKLENAKTRVEEDGRNDMAVSWTGASPIIEKDVFSKNEVDWVKTKQKRKRLSTPRHLSLKNSPKKRQIKKWKRLKHQNTSILDSILKTKDDPDLESVRALRVWQLHLLGKELKLKISSGMKKDALQNLVLSNLLSLRSLRDTSRIERVKDSPVPWSPPDSKINSSPIKIVNSNPEKGVRVTKLPVSVSCLKRNIGVLEPKQDKPLTVNILPSSQNHPSKVAQL